MTGSLGYAERLSWRDDLGGQLGDPELSEADADLERKVDALADLVADAKAKGGAVVHTGAGISTSVGIPDFRGPNGIWTLQKEGKSMPAASCRFDRARPSFTHVALVALQREGYVRYLVSCNVDCLHVRSGYPREEMAELHGNCFAERCELCETEYVRDFEMPSVGFKTTVVDRPRRGKDDGSGRGGRLRDQVLDWEDPLPPEELKRAERESKEAALALVLGSSLQITPSCDLPLKTTRRRRDGSEAGKLAIVNLQMTPKDRHATLVVHAKVDRVMWGLTRRLGVAVPEYAPRRVDRLARERNASGSGGRSFESEWTARTDGDVPCRGWRPRAWNFTSWTRTGGSSRRRSKRATGSGRVDEGFDGNGGGIRRRRRTVGSWRRRRSGSRRGVSTRPRR